ncbi:hypothetical protein CAPTEDRAFT_169662 [Capitella teleta]|uniref:Zinc finger protein-like 1 homolog n=1 Tax=Capitella teleta TaxID=283909 RepID=R7UXH8_CAPTE|nr:hypothetical protein CAPTEDRAFT_169662 [Capitella teleta]|eukprot:ELU08622.1 hypothetical protein CAPTEDRAFT_169662 [Capitella teleta]
MGLCKCPKKKVTNLFCFEHRVNVCEHCLVSNHSQCIVRSYLQWLQDSDYDPSCRLCGKVLGDESAGPCVRLVCYDVMHWRCLDNYARQLPANTAPAGYTCPACSGPVFPANNVVSPVADGLKQLLAQVNWARAGLGLPLIEEKSLPSQVSSQPPLTDSPSPTDPSPVSGDPDVRVSVASQMMSPYTPVPTHSVITVDDAQNAYARMSEKTETFTNPRRAYEPTKEDLLDISTDHDVDKYKRRPAWQWFSRWFQSNSTTAKRRDPNARCKRMATFIVIGIIAFFTVIIILSQLGRHSTDNDPFLDPMANPNIRVGDQ